MIELLTLYLTILFIIGVGVVIGFYIPTILKVVR